ncbi:hypothetical protein P8936_00325 [Edaphobacter paludis]|uniref:Uncharacterized protein n=1 Tax=Edaphobacter paludis TaxID=3035702 RepID=A0AAU7CZX4_9BACT
MPHGHERASKAIIFELYQKDGCTASPHGDVQSITRGSKLVILFEGSEQKIGVADRLFGWLRLCGFRADLVWLFFSTIVLAFTFISFLIKAKENPAAQVNTVLCLAGVLAFCLFAYHVVTSGLLYFG